jgi:hypothetical protein
MDDRPIPVAMTGDSNDNVDHLAGSITAQIRCREPDAVRQVVDVHECLDHAGTTEIIEGQHPLSESTDQAVRWFRHQADSKVLRQPAALGHELGMTSAGLRRRDLLDLIVDRRIDRSVEVGDLGE